MFGTHWMRWIAVNGNVAHRRGTCRLCDYSKEVQTVWPEPTSPTSKPAYEARYIPNEVTICAPIAQQRLCITCGARIVDIGHGEQLAAHDAWHESLTQALTSSGLIMPNGGL